MEIEDKAPEAAAVEAVSAATDTSTPRHLTQDERQQIADIVKAHITNDDPDKDLKTLVKASLKHEKKKPAGEPPDIPLDEWKAILDYYENGKTGEKPANADRYAPLMVSREWKIGENDSRRKSIFGLTDIDYAEWRNGPGAEWVDKNEEIEEHIESIRLDAQNEATTAFLNLTYSEANNRDLMLDLDTLMFYGEIAVYVTDRFNQCRNEMETAFKRKSKAAEAGHLKRKATDAAMAEEVQRIYNTTTGMITRDRFTLYQDDTTRKINYLDLQSLSNSISNDIASYKDGDIEYSIWIGDRKVTMPDKLSLTDGSAGSRGGGNQLKLNLERDIPVPVLMVWAMISGMFAETTVYGTKAPDATVYFSLSKYAEATGSNVIPRKMPDEKEQDAENARAVAAMKKFVKRLDKNLDFLDHFEIKRKVKERAKNGREYLRWRTFAYTSSHDIDEKHDIVQVNLDPQTARDLAKSYTAYFPPCLFRIDPRNPNAFRIAMGIVAHESIDRNMNKGTDCTLSLESLLSYTPAIPTFETLQIRKQRNWKDKIKTPFETAMALIVEVGYIKRWQYRDRRSGATYTPEQAQALIKDQYKRLMVDFVLSENGLKEERKKMNAAKKAAAEQAKAESEAAEAKQAKGKKKTAPKV